MAMRYADEDDVLDLLDMTISSDRYDALVRLENGLCDVFDHKIGTSFGAASTAEERVIVVGLISAYDYFSWGYPFVTASFNHSTCLVLDTPIRSVSSIKTGGTWNGTTWVGSTTLTTAQYRLTSLSGGLYYAIDALYGTWAGIVRITGIWGDQATLVVPDDVRQALTFLTVNEWHTDHASPAGQIGPEGMVTPRNPWAFEKVKAAISRHTVVQVLV